MAWQVKGQHVDKALGLHVVHMEEPDTGAEHKFIVLVGHDACPLCGHVQLRTAHREMDVPAMIEEELKLLTQSHAESGEHAKKCGAPVMRADGKAR